MKKIISSGFYIKIIIQWIFIINLFPINFYCKIIFTAFYSKIISNAIL